MVEVLKTVLDISTLPNVKSRKYIAAKRERKTCEKNSI
jgi:hypothetical protein